MEGQGQKMIEQAEGMLRAISTLAGNLIYNASSNVKTSWAELIVQQIPHALTYA